MYNRAAYWESLGGLLRMNATVFAKRYQEWVQGRLGVVQWLAEKRGQHVADAGVILSALISGLSSDAFAKTLGDKKRFIELLVNEQTAGRDSLFRTISLVSLEKAHPGTALGSGFPGATSAPSSANNDLPCIEARTIDTISDKELCKKTGLGMKPIRKHSYAGILYEGLRCSYLHEYRAGHCALLPDDGNAGSSDLVMYNEVGEIFFSLHHCSVIIEGIAENLANNARCGSDGHARLQYQEPPTLWCDG